MMDFILGLGLGVIGTFLLFVVLTFADNPHLEADEIDLQ